MSPYREGRSVRPPSAATPWWRRLLWPFDLLRARWALWRCRRVGHVWTWKPACERCGAYVPGDSDLVFDSAFQDMARYSYDYAERSAGRTEALQREVASVRNWRAVTPEEVASWGHAFALGHPIHDDDDPDRH